MRIASLKKMTVAAALSFALTAPGLASAATVAMVSDSPGTTFNAIASGAATVVTKNSDLKVVLRTHGGPTAYLPILDQGEAAFGAASANSSWQALKGIGEMKQLHNLRIARAGAGALSTGFIVRADSGITSVEDLKGKRVSSNFGGHFGIQSSIKGTLATADMTWDDVVQVPVTGANDGIDALVNGRLDASWASLGQPRAREADVQIGIRYISVANTPKSVAALRKHVFPGAKLQVYPVGAAPGILEPTALMTYDAYLVTNNQTPDEQVTTFVKALWENDAELAKAHKRLAGFTNEHAVTDAPMLPYHPAAVAFYKEQGVWSAEMDKIQADMMEQSTKK